MPSVTVKFYGPARDIAGRSSVSLRIEDGDTVGSIAGRLSEQHPRLGAALGIRLAVNRTYVPLDHLLCDGDEIAVIPPVSGGAPPRKAWITREPIDPQSIVQLIQTDGAGAVVSFLGTVRAETHDGKPLVALEYHAYEEMAVEQMDAIRERATEQFDILDAAIVHRLGRLELGTVSIAIVAAAAHRRAAFDGCQWILDAVKTDVPIWKKDIWTDGSQTWVDPTRP